MKVLLINTRASDEEILRAVLAEEMELTVVNSGEEAEGLLKGHKFDVLAYNNCSSDLTPVPPFHKAIVSVVYKVKTINLEQERRKRK